MTESPGILSRFKNFITGSSTSETKVSGEDSVSFSVNDQEIPKLSTSTHNLSTKLKQDVQKASNPALRLEAEANVLHGVRNLLEAFRVQTIPVLLKQNKEGILHFKDRKPGLNEGHSKFILSALAELLSFDKYKLRMDGLRTTINVVEPVMKILGYDEKTNTIAIRDPHNNERQVKVPLDSRIMSLRSIDSIYVKYYLLAIREMTRIIKDELHIVSDDPKSLKNATSFINFRENLKETLRIVDFGTRELGVSNYKKALNQIKFSKKNEMVDKLLGILKDKDHPGAEQMIAAIASAIEITNTEKDQTYLFGEGTGPRDNYLSVLKAIGNPRLEKVGVLQALLGKPEAFFDSYVNYVVYILHEIIDSEKIQSALNDRQDITKAEFEKVISCSLAKSSLDSYERFIARLEQITEGSSKDGQYARQLIHYKSKILPLVLISIFGLHTSPEVSIEAQRRFKDIFSYTRKKSGKLSFNYEVVSANDFNNFMNYLVSEYKYRFGALFVNRKEGLKEGTLDYQNLSAFREDWLHYMLSVLVDLISNPHGSSDPSRNDKIEALVNFFSDISDYETNIIKQFEGLLSNKQRLSKLRLSEQDIIRIKKFRKDLAAKDLKTILGFDPKGVFKDKERRQREILEVELYAIIQALSGEKSDNSAYQLKWKQDLLKSRNSLYKPSPTGHDTTSLKKLFHLKLNQIQSLGDKPFNLKEFLNIQNKSKFLKSFTENLINGTTKELIPEDLRCLISLARLGKNRTEIFGNKETSESAYDLFIGTLNNLLVELDSKTKTSPDNIHEILSDPKRSMYFLDFMENSLIHGIELDLAPELAGALYLQALTALKKSSNHPINAEDLMDVNSYERRLLGLFMNPKIRANIKQLSPNLYQAILGIHSNLVTNYMQHAQSLMNFLSERVKLKIKSGARADLSRIENVFSRLVLDVYYPMELNIAHMPKALRSKYKFNGIHSFLAQIGEVNSSLIAKLIDIADKKITSSSAVSKNTKELKDKGLFAKALLDRAHGLALKVERISNLHDSFGSFQQFLIRFRNLLENASLNLYASSPHLGPGTIQAIFQKLFQDSKLNEREKIYLRLIYSHVQKHKSLGSIKDLELPKERAEAIFGAPKESTGHLFIGDDMFRSLAGRERLDAISKFCEIVPVLYSLKLNEKNYLLENAGLSNRIKKIEDIVKLRPIFYRRDERDLQGGDRIPQDKIKILRDKLSASLMELKELNPFLKNNHFKWVKIAPLEGYKDMSTSSWVKGFLDPVNIGSELAGVRKAIEELSFSNMPYSQIKGRLNTRAPLGIGPQIDSYYGAAA